MFDGSDTVVLYDELAYEEIRPVKWVPLAGSVDAAMAASFIAATKLPKAVVDLQLNERTDITNGHIGAPQRDSILQAGFALQKVGVIPASVDVTKTLDDLIDNSYV